MLDVDSSGRIATLCAVLILGFPPLAWSQTPPNSQAPATASQDASAAPIPIGSFVAPPFLDAPALSPDGEKVASRLLRRKSAVLNILRIFDKPGTPGALREVTFTGSRIDSFRWLTNETLLVYSPPSLHVHDVVSNRTRLLADSIDGTRIADVLHVDREGRFLLVQATRVRPQYPDVHRIDIETGATVKVVDGLAPITNWIADARGVVRLGMGLERNKIKIVYRDRDNEKFRSTKLGWDDLDGDVDQVQFQDGGGAGYVVTNSRTGRFGLYEFDLQKTEIGAAIFEHPMVDIDGVLVDEKGEIDGVAYTDDRARIAWLDPAERELQTEIDTRLKDRVNRIASRTKDDTRFVIFSYAAHDPGRYYFFDRSQGVLSLLATPIEALKDKRMASVQPVSYRSRDGIEIPAYLTLPPGSNSQKLPLVVMPHGGPHARDTWVYDANVQFLASRGYAVLQPNFRGSSGYGKEFMERGFGEWGRAMQNDVSDGVRWLIDTGVADPKRVCIMGASYGGYAALMGVIQTPELYRCAISFAGVSDVEAIMKSFEFFLPPQRYRKLRERYVGKQKSSLRSVSPLRLAAQVSAPVLLVHNSADLTVPFSHSRKMGEALKKAGKEYEFLEIEALGHGFDKPEDHLRFLMAVEAFLQKHIPPGPIVATQ